MQTGKLRPPLIAIFNDFGITGPYQGQMAAVLATEAPNIPHVTLMADAPMFDPQSAGLLLLYLSQNLPSHTLTLAVVDPGVGGSRLPIMVRTEKHLFVGPDNGLFIPIAHHSKSCEIETITWRPRQLSNTFHGRDLFAPVAAKLANGENVEGSSLMPHKLVGYDSPINTKRIIYIDNYGNAMTGINSKEVDEDTVFSVNGSSLHYARTFSSTLIGQSFWYRNSMGMVEFAVNRGNAANLLKLDLGMPVDLSN
jgi:S-adenosylmethionine hydrolase